MRVEDFDKIVEMWKKHILSDVLKDYKLEIDEDVPKEFAAIALYLDSSTVRAAGEVLEYYDGYRQAASDILNLIGVEMLQDDTLKVIRIRRKAVEEDKQELLKKYIWG
ncbi:MAG: hypothetical protein KatS3mg078_0267 [Deltaproteobacteria bacterium]|jgi:hypothetical protein|nr:MAG: hypothetical protein KatS3mg078_0267 [Deltaproteobacteria bacterium]